MSDTLPAVSIIGERVTILPRNDIPPAFHGAEAYVLGVDGSCAGGLNLYRVQIVGRRPRLALTARQFARVRI